MENEEIQWEDPPPRENPGRGYSKWKSRLQALRDHPGRWAVFQLGTVPSAGSCAQAIRNGKITGGEPGAFEATARDTRVYARFAG